MKNYNKDIFEWNEFPECDLIWVDPPWENKMVKFFQTQLKKDTGIIKNHTITDILIHFSKTAKRNIPIVIEYSVKGIDLVIQTMQDHGHKLITINHCIQSMGRPFVILVFNVPVKIDTTVKGRDIIINTLQDTKFNVIFDCFAGIGFTAGAVLQAGKKYIGSEINKIRYDKLCRVNK